MKQIILSLHNVFTRLLALRFKKSGVNLRFFPLDSNFTFESITLGDNVFIGRHAWIRSAHGEIVIEDNVVIGPFFRIYGGDHIITYTSDLAVHQKKEINQDPTIRIGRNSWIGGNVTFTKNGSIGDNCVVGAGAIVTKPFPNNVVIAGNPARVIKSNNIDVR